MPCHSTLRSADTPILEVTSSGVPAEHQETQKRSLSKCCTALHGILAAEKQVWQGQSKPGPKSLSPYITKLQTSSNEWRGVRSLSARWHLHSLHFERGSIVWHFEACRTCIILIIFDLKRLVPVALTNLKRHDLPDMLHTCATMESALAQSQSSFSCSFMSHSLRNKC